MIIGLRIQERIDAFGTSQAAVARAVGLRPSTINGLVNGEQRSSTKLHLIARELRTTVAYLTGETSDPDSDAPDSPLLDRADLDLLDMIQRLEPKARAAVVEIVRGLTGAPAAPTLHEPRRELCVAGSHA